MSMSLRDQLLQAGLVSQKQVKEVERQQERQARQPPKPKRSPTGGQHPAGGHARASGQGRAADHAPAGGPGPALGQRPANAQQPSGGQGRPQAAGQAPAPSGRPDARTAQAAKFARDQALNRQQQEKAQKKALQAQIKQLVDQNRLPQADGGESYNFVDGNKIRHVAVSGAMRSGLARGEIVIVRHGGQYHLMPAAAAVRVRERDPDAVISGGTPQNTPADEAYQAFAIPDDLIW